MSKAVKTTCIICCLCLIVCVVAVPAYAVSGDYDPADYVSSVSVVDGVKTVNYRFPGITPMTNVWNGVQASNDRFQIDVDARQFSLTHYPLGVEAQAGWNRGDGRVIVKDIIPGSPIDVSFKLSVAYFYEQYQEPFLDVTLYTTYTAGFHVYDENDNYQSSVTIEAGTNSINFDATAGYSEQQMAYEVTGTVPLNAYYVLPWFKLDCWIGDYPHRQLYVIIDESVLSMSTSVDSVVEQSHQMSVIKDKLADLNDSLGNVNDKLDDILNQPQQEQDSANQAGKDALDNIVSVVPDHSSDLVNAFSGLASSMSYDGTVAKIAIPAVSMPGIDGLFDGFVIMQPQELDFEVYFDMLPEYLLLLVQSLFTAALIVFCFKELYSTIQYCLTLRG